MPIYKYVHDPYFTSGYILVRTDRHDTAVCLITNHYREAGTTHGHMTRRRVVQITWSARRGYGRGLAACEAD